ncbi:MAG: aldehyde dehydrogenase family protein [Verrucomicrobiota bacterium]
MNSNLPDLVHNPKLRIGNDWVTTQVTFSVLNPATGQIITHVPQGDADVVSKATAAAYQTFLSNRNTPAHLRSSRLAALAAQIEVRSDDFAALIVAEAGKPIALARIEVQRAILTFRLAAEEARHQQGGLLDLDATPAGNAHFGITRRFPLGPIAAITPFNFPLNLVAHKVAPALAAGNTVVLKPSPRTPLTALLLAEAVHAAGFPPGSLNVITCPNELVPGWVADPRIRMVSFTGSATVGWSLQAQAAGKRCTLELGGNAIVVLHSDADIEQAIPLITTGAFAYAGQTCVSVQRVLIHESIYAQTRERLVKHTRDSVRSGDPLDPSVLVGPMIDRVSVSRTITRIDAAVQAGARILVGGSAKGQFLEPTILEDVPETCELCCEEAFAPVLVLESYNDFAEVVQKVNGSRYGLQTGIFTRDFSLAWNAFQNLEVGAVLVNQIPTWRVENMPYGGVKSSGLGREGIQAAMEEMSEPRLWIWKTS